MIPVTTEIETLIDPWIAPQKHINLVIGVLQGDECRIQGWGTLNTSASKHTESPSESGPPDGDTLFEIGSITKVFTSTLLSILVERQELDLAKPLNQLGAVYQNLPDNVTLESLATHTSGLPRLPKNFQKSFLQDRQNPYAAYTFEELHEYLQDYGHKPGKTAGTIDYSNLGVGLLGNVLAAQCGQSYEDAIVDHICNPLELSDTRISLNKAQQARFAMGYSGDGKPTKPWDIPTLAGAGALRSTAKDMLTFLAANLQSEQTSITQAILNTHELRYETLASSKGLFSLIDRAVKWIQRWRGGPLVQMDIIGIALGWLISYIPAIDRQVYWHNGGTGGYRSFCGFIKETRTGVIVLSNHADSVSSLFGRYSVDTIGFKILEMANERQLNLGQPLHVEV